MAAAAESSLVTSEEAQRSTDVLATVSDWNDGREVYELELLGEGVHYSPSHDKGTATLLKDGTLHRGATPPRKLSKFEAELTGKDPDRWVLSDIHRQKRQEAQVRVCMTLPFLFVALVLGCGRPDMYATQEVLLLESVLDCFTFLWPFYTVIKCSPLLLLMLWGCLHASCNS